MIKFEENQNDFLVNKSQILNRVTQYKSQSQSALQVCTKQCSYRYSDSPYPIKVIFQQKAEQKRCSVQFLNYKLEQKQIQQFSEFTKKFYYEQFLQNIYHQNFTSNSSPRESLEAKINSHFFIKQEELQSPIIKIPKANNNFLTNEELLQQVTLYLQQIKQQFLNSISSKIEEINFLNIKEGQKMNLNQEINSIFEKFFCTVRRKKTEQQKEKFINSSLQKRKRRYFFIKNDIE